jgi:tight adherence protein C
MSTLPLLTAAAVALGVVGVGLVLSVFISSRNRSRVQDRLAPGVDAAVPGDSGLFSRMAAGGRGLERWLGDDESVETLLTRAGWRETQARTVFYLLQFALPMMLMGLVLLLWLSAGRGSNFYLVLFLFVGFAVGVLAPRFLLRQAVADRQARLRSEVPVFINLLVLLFEAGLSTRQALQSLVRDGHGVLPELSIELRAALRQIEAGADIGEVLTAVGHGLQVPELTGVLAVLRQIERYGGEVREPLLAALAVIEERRGLSMRERVGAVTSYMTVVMVLFFFPALLLCVGGPAVAAIFKAFRGVIT